MTNKETKVFVSYTQRDGYVTNDILHGFHCNLSQISLPFVHLIDRSPIRFFEQLHVIRELFSSHMLILIESPMVHKSPWVKLELLISRLKLMPVIRLSLEDLSGFKK